MTEATKARIADLLAEKDRGQDLQTAQAQFWRAKVWIEVLLDEVRVFERALEAERGKEQP